LDAPQDSDPPIAARIDAALAQGQHPLARQILAEGEAAATIPNSDAMMMRARIAQAQGDLIAARAILIHAVETHPDHSPARRALAEVMVAMGAAADVRAVLTHLAHSPGEDSARADFSRDSAR